MINLKKNIPIKCDPNIVTQPDNICDGCHYHKASCICHLLPKPARTESTSNQFDGLGVKTDHQGFLLNA